MNDRIQHVARAAGLDYLPDGDLERFARLIVEECARDFDKTYMVGGETMGAYIRQKFGVEA